MAKLYGFCNSHTGQPSQWGPEDVIGLVVDEAGHAVGSHYSSSMSFLEQDLKRSAARHNPEAEYVWCGDNVSAVPAPCPGCEECAADRSSSGE